MFPCDDPATELNTQPSRRRRGGDAVQRIVIDPEILCGKPVIVGTRLSVQFIIGLLAQGWSVPQVTENYPGISADDVFACLEYAAKVLQSERVYPLPL